MIIDSTFNVRAATESAARIKIMPKSKALAFSVGAVKLLAGEKDEFLHFRFKIDKEGFFLLLGKHPKSLTSRINREDAKCRLNTAGVIAAICNELNIKDVVAFEVGGAIEKTLEGYRQYPLKRI